MIPAVASEGVRSWWIYAAGAAVYLMIERWLHKPVWFYVLGHELTHALSGLLSGAKILSLKAGSKGGEVRLSKTNAFIALSPYIFPFYAILTLAAYSLIRNWWVHPHLTHGFQFLLGFTMAFHGSLTWGAIHRSQPDLRVLGLFLSGVLIAMGNLLILGVLVVSLFKKTPSLKQYFLTQKNETIFVWQKTGDLISNFESRVSGKTSPE